VALARADLESRYGVIETEAREELAALAPLASDRKAFALMAVGSPHRALLFAMLDVKTTQPSSGKTRGQAAVP
jgi:hypothetical protein